MPLSPTANRFGRATCFRFSRSFFFNFNACHVLAFLFSFFLLLHDEPTQRALSFQQMLGGSVVTFLKDPERRSCLRGGNMKIERTRKSSRSERARGVPSSRAGYKSLLALNAVFVIRDVVSAVFTRAFFRYIVWQQAYGCKGQ